MVNLLKETLENLKLSGHSISDIIFIGSERSGHSCTWEEFKSLSDREYNNSYGTQEVATDLCIVFSDGSKMWRSEYDGSEQWAYSPPFKMPAKTIEIKSLFIKPENAGRQDLEEINRPNMPDIKFIVIGDIGAHNGFVVEVDYDHIWQAGNEDGWTYQEIEGPHGTRLGEYNTSEEAYAHLAEWLRCDAAEQGRYCYTHNPHPPNKTAISVNE